MAVYKQRSMVAATIPGIVAQQTQKSKRELEIKPKIYPILKADDWLFFSKAMSNGTKEK